MSRPHRASGRGRSRSASEDVSSSVANLGLKPEATASTSWAGAGLARALDAWQGPGVVAVAGNLFDISGRSDPAEAVSASLLTHRDVADALKNFASGTERQVLCIPGSADRVLGEDAVARHPLDELGVEVASAVDLHLKSGAGTRVVRVEASVPAIEAETEEGPERRPTTVTADGLPAGPPGAHGPAPAGAHGVPVARTLTPDPTAPWQEGLDRLTDPAATQRFLTSRLLYRRFARFAWWLLVPVAVAIALRLPFVIRALDHLLLAHPGPARELNRANTASWGSAWPSSLPSGRQSWRFWAWCSGGWPGERGGPWVAATSTASSTTVRAICERGKPGRQRARCPTRVPPSTTRHANQRALAKRGARD